MEKDPRGTHLIAIGHKTVSWAVAELIRGVQTDELAKLKVGSGEHLAALPVSIPPLSGLQTSVPIP